MQSVNAAKISWTIDANNNPRFSEITKNPSELEFVDLTVYKFEIQHGGCGGDSNWTDCDNDRQRVELKDGYKTSLQTFGSKPKKVKKYYRTNLFIPDVLNFPEMSPMSQMIHQVKLHKKNNPIWMVHYIDEGLKISTDSGDSCRITKDYVPREQWLEIEIHADYTVNGKVNDSDPSFSYLIDGQIVCQFQLPLITKRALKDGGKQKLQLKFGIYNTFPSKWLMNQAENQRWIKENNLVFNGYQQDSNDESNGAVRSAIGSPFNYDWPVKLPAQMLYYSDWFSANSRAELGLSRFKVTKSSEIEEAESPPEVSVDFSVSTKEVCARALPEWKADSGSWSKHAEARGLTSKACVRFLK